MSLISHDKPRKNAIHISPQNHSMRTSIVKPKITINMADVVSFIGGTGSIVLLSDMSMLPTSWDHALLIGWGFLFTIVSRIVYPLARGYVKYRYKKWGIKYNEKDDEITPGK